MFCVKRKWLEKGSSAWNIGMGKFRRLLRAQGMPGPAGCKAALRMEPSGCRSWVPVPAQGHPLNPPPSPTCKVQTYSVALILSLCCALGAVSPGAVLVVTQVSSQGCCPFEAVCRALCVLGAIPVPCARWQLRVIWCQPWPEGSAGEFCPKTAVVEPCLLFGKPMGDVGCALLLPPTTAFVTLALRALHGALGPQ